MSEMKQALTLSHINKSFSGVQVLKDVNLTLNDGRILALCGENGAGKSTLMNILGGIHAPDSGEMAIAGEAYVPRTPHDATTHGIAFIHQELSLFQNLTVMQNFMIDNLPVNKLGVIDRKKIKASISEHLGVFVGDIDINRRVETFTMGQKQLIEIAKELSKNARVVIFDEPTTSLSNKEKELLFRIIREIRASGINIIYISHILADVMELCDDILVLRNGETVGGGAVADFTIDDIVRMMVGRGLTNLYPYVEKTSIGKETLRAEHLKSGKALQDASFSLHEGEIVGMYGLMGAGRSELARTIFGIDRLDGGALTIDGKDIGKPTPQGMKDMGVAFITENRREEGLMMPKSIFENLILADLKDISKRGVVDRKQADDTTDGMIDQIQIKTFDKNRQLAEQLSGGNQQKVVIGKWLITKPHIFILDEPTRGVDVGSKFEIYNEINNLALGHSSVLFISSEMEELMGVCDRILIMCGGRVVAELDREAFSSEAILKSAIGGGQEPCM